MISNFKARLYLFFTCFTLLGFGEYMYITGIKHPSAFLILKYVSACI